jgi:hypothetical protein
LFFCSPLVQTQIKQISVEYYTSYQATQTLGCLNGIQLCVHYSVLLRMSKVVQVVYSSDLYLKGGQFTSWSGCELSWLTAFVVFFSPCRKTLGPSISFPVIC